MRTPSGSRICSNLLERVGAGADEIGFRFATSEGENIVSRSPERCHARVLPDVLVSGHHGEPVRVCERDDHTVEWIPVEERQCGRRARNAGIKGDFPQIVPLD